jgi:glycosyltransferase involved in cell wall biosynthesis
MALSPAGISVVIAARNEAARLPLLLADLATAPQLVTEVLVVDGASGDGTPRLAALAGARVLACSPGRGRQLALGISRSSGAWLLLLHADARLGAGWQAALASALERPPAAWYFNLAIDAPSPALRLVELGVAIRPQPAGPRRGCGAHPPDGRPGTGAAPAPAHPFAFAGGNATGGWAPLAGPGYLAGHLGQCPPAACLAAGLQHRAAGCGLLRHRADSPPWLLLPYPLAWPGVTSLAF